jgi:hypothetical protein
VDDGQGPGCGGCVDLVGVAGGVVIAKSSSNSSASGDDKGKDKEP